MFGLFDCVGTGGDELVCCVVLVGGDEETAAEAGTGFADGAAEDVFIRTTPARRIEARGAFVGLGPVRAGARSMPPTDSARTICFRSGVIW